MPLAPLPASRRARSPAPARLPPFLWREPRSTLSSARLHQLGAKPLKFGVGYRARFLELIELRNFVRHAEADYTAQLLPRLLRLLGITLGHPSSLSNQIGEDTEIRKHDQPDHPKGFAPPGNIVTPKQ